MAQVRAMCVLTAALPLSHSGTLGKVSLAVIIIVNRLSTSYVGGIVPSILHGSCHLVHHSSCDVGANTHFPDQETSNEDDTPVGSLPALTLEDSVLLC